MYLAYLAYYLALKLIGLLALVAMSLLMGFTCPVAYAARRAGVWNLCMALSGGPSRTGASDTTRADPSIGTQVGMCPAWPSWLRLESLKD